MNDLTSTAESITIEKINNVFSMNKDVQISLAENYFYELAKKHPQMEQSEFLDYVHKCILFQADPRKKEIYLIPRKQSYKDHDNVWHNKIVATVVVSYQFFIKKAQRTMDLDGFSLDTKVEQYFDINTMKDGKTLVSTCSVKRKSMSGIISYTARFPEFAIKDRNGKLTDMWRNKPYLMLEKCALANAMRQAFPEDMMGVYVTEEIDGKEESVTTDGFEIKNEIKQILDKTKENISNQEKKEKENEEKDNSTINNIKNMIGKLTDSFKNTDELKKIYDVIGVENFNNIQVISLTDSDRLLDIELRLKEM